MLLFVEIWLEKCLTRVQIAVASAIKLSFSSGTGYTMVQLIEPKRIILTMVEAKLTKIIKEIKKY